MNKHKKKKKNQQKKKKMNQKKKFVGKNVQNYMKN